MNGNEQENRYRNLGRYIAYLLRHNPEAAGITLDKNGCANVSELIDGVCKTGRSLDKPVLDIIVSTDDKKRFAYSEDGSKIRASQGHSIIVDLELKERIPPEILYHGTALRNMTSIKQKGIYRGNRNYVHFSEDEVTATKVGARHGEPIVLKVRAKAMFDDGYKFYLSDNGVWLTEYVPPEYVCDPDVE